MKTIKQVADEIGVSKTSIRNEIAKQGLQSSLRKNGNQFVIDEKCENLIKSAFKSRNGKITAKVVCEDTANQNAQVTDNQNEQVCDYQHKIDVLETDNKRLLEEIGLLKDRLKENKEEVIYLRSQLTEKDAQLKEKDNQIATLNARLEESLRILDQQQQLQAMEKKIQVLENKQEDVVEPVEEHPETKHWWEIWKELRSRRLERERSGIDDSR